MKNHDNVPCVQETRTFQMLSNNEDGGILYNNHRTESSC